MANQNYDILLGDNHAFIAEAAKSLEHACSSKCSDSDKSDISLK